MIRFVRAFFAFLIAGVALQESTRGDFALELTNPGELANPQLFTLGWEFTVDETITVTQLGKYLLNNNTTLSQDSSAGIWRVSDAQLLGSVTIPTSAIAVLDAANQKVVFESLVTPIVLQPGYTYRIGVEEFGGGDPYGRTNNGMTASALAASPIHLGVGVYTQHPVGFAEPESSFGLPGQNYFGPNMRFTVRSVPEPSSLVLVSTAAAFGLVAHRRRVGKGNGKC